MNNPRSDREIESERPVIYTPEQLKEVYETHRADTKKELEHHQATLARLTPDHESYKYYERTVAILQLIILIYETLIKNPECPIDDLNLEEILNASESNPSLRRIGVIRGAISGVDRSMRPLDIKETLGRAASHRAMLEIRDRMAGATDTIVPKE